MKLPKELQNKKKVEQDRPINSNPSSRTRNLREIKIKEYLSELSAHRKEQVPKQIYQIKILIEESNPPIWRRVLISNDTYLGDFHKSMENWFDWSGFHIHDFIFFLDPHDDIEVSTQEYDLNEYGIRLCDVFREELRTIMYMYDPGDNWLHRITLEKVFPHDGYFDGPICVGGERASPPEDSGGVWAYEDLLHILDDPSHPEHSDAIHWVGEDFDPEEINVPIRKMSQEQIEEKFGKSEPLMNYYK